MKEKLLEIRSKIQQELKGVRTQMESMYESVDYNWNMDPFEIHMDNLRDLLKDLEYAANEDV